MNDKKLWDLVNYKNSYDVKSKKVNEQFIFTMLLSKTLTMFKYDNLPKTLPVEIIEYTLQTNGIGFVFKYGDDLICLPISLLYDEVDYYNRPIKGQVYFNDTKELKTVNLDTGVVIKNDYLNQGLTPLYNKFSSLIADSELTLYIANIWKRASKVISASDDQTIQSAREYVKKIEDGDISIISTNPILNDLNINTDNVTSVSINELIQYDNYIKSILYNEIGLSFNKSLKKERLITSEVEQDNNSIYPFIDNMYSCRVKGVEEINTKFDLDISVDFNSSWSKNKTENEPENESEPNPENEVDNDWFYKL